MATLLSWDDIGERYYETGVDHGVLYVPDMGVYDTGFVWNGLVAVTESPTGAEANPQYADNIKYLNLVSAEEFEGTIEAFTYPDEFQPFDGFKEPVPGMLVGQQNRGYFGMSYRTLIGNDTEGTDAGYKLHLLYGCQVAPTERAYSTVNDSPEAITFSWELTTNPVAVTGHRPTSVVTLDSRTVDPTGMAAVEALLYGDDTGPTEPQLPTPDEIVALLTP